MEPNYKASLVINTIFQLGLLTFAVVLGVVCNDISAAVENVQSGNYTVVESGHTVILNWNKLTIPVLRQVKPICLCDSLSKTYSFHCSRI